MIRGLGKRSSRSNTASDQKHERGYMMTLINSITDAVFSIDSKGIVTTYNAAALNLLDTNAAIAGQHISHLLHLQTTERVDIDMFDELARSPSIRTRDDLIMPIDEEDYLRLETTCAPIMDGPEGVTGYVLILRDITKMKSLEEERDEFISVVSHELRTPVAIAEGSLDNARLLAEKGYSERAQAAIEEAYSQVMFLSKMVNDLSTLSRAERGMADTPERINVEALVRSLHDDYAPEAHSKGLAFNLDIDARAGEVYTSRLYLYELLQNFITNAIKYTQEGSITLYAHKHESAVEFAVTDTGIGIGKSDLKRIFDRFYRAEDYRTRETNGTGLGLYVASKLARKIGCRIEVKSRLNHGSTFSVSVPTADASSARAAHDGPSSE
ncbi:MAG: ATP-binding protein [Candidatus Saccharibacteria bacterium]|nr:ATP-binding protein [Candidatus Saccharibacteria bacterium]